MVCKLIYFCNTKIKLITRYYWKDLEYPSKRICIQNWTGWSRNTSSPIEVRLSGIWLKNTLWRTSGEGNQEVAGAIVLVYDHHKRDLQTKSTDVQHDYHHLILSVQHVHLDHHNCLETIAVKGKAKELKRLSNSLIAIKGVKHGELVMTAQN